MSQLWDDAPNYASACFPTPRPFQESAHAALRAGALDGHKNQLLMAPTGAGKSYLGLRIIHEALLKGKKAVFMCDRTTLINQTSEAADRYGLSAHGILQASHWRMNHDAPFQIASAQTIARRQWPDADVIVIDEAHTQMKAWTEYIPTCRAKVIGLSATPFSDGLGKLFTNLINATTMDELTRSGVLVPMRVMSCTMTNMDGAATAGGEWTDGAAEQRGMEIVGDVVAEWIKHAQNRKTIVFGATIKHCEELCRQFNEIGVMAAVFTSNTLPTEREFLLKEYRKKDSTLRVLVSVEALAKGFDVPDVGCVVDCRPLRKSLSTAIQMWGRGLRSSPDTGKVDCLLLDHCIATGQRVLTHRGLVRIEEILLSDKLWDGHEFVSHKGVISRGIKPVIRYAGLTATADHPVKTKIGWRTLGQCSDEQTAIITTGVGRSTIRERDDCFTRRDLAGAASTTIHACSLRVRRLWLSVSHIVDQFKGWSHQGMQTLQSASTFPEMALCEGAQHEATMQQPERSQVQGLRGARDRVPFRIRDHLRTMGAGEHRDTRESGGNGAGQNRQQRALRTGEYSVVNPPNEHEQHSVNKVVTTDAQVQDSIPGSSVRGYIAKSISRFRAFISGNRRPMGKAVIQAEREVWDVLDCGPRNSFTCEGLLVHNSGNITRFLEDYTSIFFDGLDALDMGEKLDKAIRRDKEDFEAKGCPSCGYKPFAKRCMSCGYEKVAQALIENIPGEMREITLGKKKVADDLRNLYEQACTYARAHSAPEKQSARAYFIFKDMAGTEPPKGWSIQTTPDVQLSRNFINRVKAKNIAFNKSRQAVAA